MKVLYFSIAKLCYSKICLWHQLLYIFPRKYCSIASTASGFEAPTSQSFESPSKGTRLYISSSLTIFFTFVCCYSSTVWPDVVVKSSPNVSKSCPKSSNSSFVHKIKVFQHCPKSCQSFWATFVTNFVAQELSKITQSGHTALRRELDLKSQLHEVSMKKNV